MVACPACGKAVDPLRAGHVAILDAKFFYFCDRTCKADYLGRTSLIPQEEVETAAPPEVAEALAARPDRVAPSRASRESGQATLEGGPRESDRASGAAVVPAF